MPENRRAVAPRRGDSGANPGLLFHSSVFLRRFVVYCVLYAPLRDAWPRRDDAAEARFRALFLERFMGETIDTAPEQRRAVLVAVVRERQDERQANEYLDELEFLAEWPHVSRPVLLCEYAHSMGNSTGGLNDYWTLIRRHKRTCASKVLLSIPRRSRCSPSDGGGKGPPGWYAWGPLF